MKHETRSTKHETQSPKPDPRNPKPETRETFSLFSLLFLISCDCSTLNIVLSKSETQVPNGQTREHVRGGKRLDGVVGLLHHTGRRIGVPCPARPPYTGVATLSQGDESIVTPLETPLLDKPGNTFAAASDLTGSSASYTTLDDGSGCASPEYAHHVSQ